MITTEEMMDFLFMRRAPNLPPSGLAEVFCRLIWCMDDNGSEINQVCRKWVASDTVEKVKIVLAMTETFPAENREKMMSLFASITNRWPELKATCDEILDSWDRTMKGDK